LSYYFIFFIYEIIMSNRTEIEVDEYFPRDIHITKDERTKIDEVQSLYNGKPLLHKIIIKLSNNRKITYIYDNTDDAIMEYHSMSYRPDFVKIAVMKYLWSLHVRPDRISAHNGTIKVIEIDWILLDNNYNTIPFKNIKFGNPLDIHWNPLNFIGKQ